MKYVYFFGAGKAEGDGEMKEVLGGKGAGLAEMSRAGLPVPAGFTIATQVCNAYFDSGKKINGRKRHLAVDVEGFLLAVVVTAASVGDRMGAKLLVIALLNTCTRLKLIWADSGYDGKPLADWVNAVARITLQVIKRTELHVFKAVPRRWVVERSFGWLLRYRRLVRDYERRPEHHEAMVYWANVMIMTRRLARRSTDPPLRKRWGQPRSVSARHPNPTPA